MRAMTLVLVAIVISAQPAAAMDSESRPREPVELEFEGVTAFDPADIRRALVKDIDVQAAQHPQSSWVGYVGTVAENVMSGYNAKGFPRAIATARWNEARQKTVVRVTEGPRLTWSQIKVRGLNDADTKSLIRYLTEQSPAPWLTRVNSWPDETRKTRWESPTGDVTKLRPALWAPGDPACFESAALSTITDRVKEHLGVRGRLFPRIRAVALVDAEDETATLEIDIEDPGREATIGRILVEGAERNSEDEIRNYARVRSGMRYGSRITSQIQRRLWESGRFLESSVRSRVPQVASDDLRVDLKITVVEQPSVPPMAQELSPEQQALLKLGRWLADWSDGASSEDLIIEHLGNESVKKEGEPAATIRWDRVRLVGSPGFGQAITLGFRSSEKATGSDMTLLIHEGRAAVLGAGNTHLEWDLGATTGFLTNIELCPTPPGSPDDSPTRLLYGFCKLGSRAKAASLVNFALKFHPAALLAEFSATKIEATARENGILRLRSAIGELSIEEKTGRLVDFRTKTEKGELAVRLERGAARPELQRYARRLAGSKNVLDPECQTGSTLAFLVDEAIRSEQLPLTSQMKRSLTALRNLFARWRMVPLESLDLLGDADDGPDVFRLEAKRVLWLIPQLNGDGMHDGMDPPGPFLPIFGEIMPKGGSLWMLGRDALLTVVGKLGDPVNPERDLELWDAGPIAYTVAATAAAFVNEAGSRTLATQGLKRLTPEKFRRDYAPFLAGDSWFGRNLLALAEAVRLLDDADIRELAKLLPEEPAQMEFVRILMSIKGSDDHRKSLARLFDEFWKSWFKQALEEALNRLATDRRRETTMN